MNKLIGLTGVALVALGACHDATTDVGRPSVTTMTPPRGAIVAATYCAPCHGTTLQGNVAAGGRTPSLVVARQYSAEQFDLLLIAGLTRDGNYVRDTMTSTRITAISAADRHALRDYLANSWTP